MFSPLPEPVSCSETEKRDRVSSGNKSFLCLCVSNTEPQSYASTEERSTSDRDNFYIITSSASGAAKEWRTTPNRRSVLAFGAVVLLTRRIPAEPAESPPRVLGTAPRAAARHKRSVTQRAEHRSGPPAVPGAAPSRQSPGPRSPRPPWRRAGPPSHNPGQPSSARRSPTGGPGGTREFPAHRPAVPAPLEAAVPADGGGWRPMAAGPTHRTQLRRHAAPEAAERGGARGLMGNVVLCPEGAWEL